MSDTMRIDKWLWVTRMFKTRTQAGEACKGGKVKMDNHAVKPSRELKVGDIIHLNLEHMNKIVEVKELVNNRVSASMVPQLLADLTPPEEYERIQLIKKFNYEKRDHGIGRPTKKERRLIDKLKKDDS